MSNTILFSEIFSILKKGKPVKVEYISFDEARKKGGDIKTIVGCKRIKESPTPTNTSIPPSNENEMKEKSYDQDESITLELYAGEVATGQFRTIHSILIRKINDKTVII